MTFTNQIIAVATCRTPYKQKFGIPRQPGLVEARGYVELEPHVNHIDAVRGIEQYSHLWLLFCFHENLAQGWKTTVRPPRLRLRTEPPDGPRFFWLDGCQARPK